MRASNQPPRLPPHWASMVRCVGASDYQIVGLPAGVDDPVFKDRGHAEGWLADRIQLLTKRLKRGPRECLTCATKFISEGTHNRRCDSCRGAD